MIAHINIALTAFQILVILAHYFHRNSIAYVCNRCDYYHYFIENEGYYLMLRSHIYHEAGT